MQFLPPSRAIAHFGSANCPAAYQGLKIITSLALRFPDFQRKHKDKLMLINASEKFKPLKKSKGSKRKEVDEQSRLDIVETLAQFQDNDYARVFEKEHFYFNKQAIMLTNVDENGNSYEDQLEEGKKSTKLTPIKIDNGERSFSEFVITEYDHKKFVSLFYYFMGDIKPSIAMFNYKEQPLVITTKDAKYCFDPDKETLIKTEKDKTEKLGCGKILVKASFKKKSKTQPERIEISVELTPDYQKDYEIIPFHKEQQENQTAIDDFMEKYITKPFELLENVVGVEVNFNKIFYKPEKLRVVSDILVDIEKLDDQIKALEAELAL